METRLRGPCGDTGRLPQSWGIVAGLASITAVASSSMPSSARREGAHMADNLEPWEQPGAVRRDCQPHRAEPRRRLGSVAFLLALLSPLAVPAVLALGLGAVIHELGGVPGSNGNPGRS
jgi:hypothetical protein